MITIFTKKNTLFLILLSLCIASNAFNFNKHNDNIPVSLLQKSILSTNYTLTNSYNNDFLDFNIPTEASSGSGYGSNRIAVKLNALIVTGTVSPAFEYKLSYNFSLHAQLIGVHQPKGFLGTDKPLSLFALTVEPRYYPMGTYRGIFFGLNVGVSAFNMARSIIINNWSEPFNFVYHKGWNIMGGISLGWAFPIGDNFGIEPFITTGCTYSTWSNYVNEEAVSDVKKTRLDYVYAYNGGVNIVYRFGSSPYSKMSSGMKRYKGSRYNRPIYRKYNKIYNR